MSDPTIPSRNPLLPLVGAVFFLGPILALLALPWYGEITPWIGVAIVYSVGLVAHFLLVRNAYPTLPHMATGIALLQLVWVAWLAHFLPGWDPTMIGNRLPEYLAYSVPFTIALSGGMLLAFTGWRRAERVTASPTNTPDLARGCDYFIAGGAVLLFFGHFLYIPALAFVVHLFSNLRFVGGLGLMLLGDRRWLSRVVLLFALEIYFSSGSAFFHSLVLWSAIFLAFWMFCRRPSVLPVGLTLIACLFGVVALEHAKLKIRADARDAHVRAYVEGERESLPVLDRILPWGHYMVEGGIDLFTGELDDDFLRHLSMRYNQGWIVNQVMLHVPYEEPYARGETIRAAVYGAILPRFLAPDKYRAGGQEYMRRFAGYELHPGTSMNIGLSGEFYANFGRNGGIVAALCHGLLLGLVLRGFGILARRNQIFWAFAPFVLFWALKSEEGFGEILNWMSKAAIVSAALIIAIPAFRNTLLRRPESPAEPESEGGTP